MSRMKRTGWIFSLSSIKALAAYTGINEKTLTARLRRGMSMEAACQKQLFNCTYYMDGGIVKTLVENNSSNSMERI